MEPKGAELRVELKRRGDGNIDFRFSDNKPGGAEVAGFMSRATAVELATSLIEAAAGRK